MKFLHLFSIEVRTLKWTCELRCEVPAQLRIWKRNWQVDNKLGNRRFEKLYEIDNINNLCRDKAKK